MPRDNYVRLGYNRRILKKELEIGIPVIVVIAAGFLVWALLTGQTISVKMEPQSPYGPHAPVTKPETSKTPTTPPKPPSIPVEITQRSQEVFSYAHGTVMADGKIFIGMASRSGNPFPTNQLYVFTDPSDLKQFRIISIPRAGDIETMIYDEKNDKVYFTLSNNGSLEIYRIDPRTFYVSTVISTTSVNIGMKPAITTDGKYIYGITYTNPSTVFKVGIYGTPLIVSSEDHISNGHSAAIGIYGSSTELYFGGGEADLFEKVNGEDLSSISKLYFPGCSITDDTPYQKTSDVGGYVYLGCERQPYGYRVKTDDMSFVRFALPGNSFGMNIFGNDLYNAAQDANYDVFRNMDISSPKRYYVGQDIQLNELFMATSSISVPVAVEAATVAAVAAVEAATVAGSTTDSVTSTTTASVVASSTVASTTTPLEVQKQRSLFFTGWWGVKGLFEVAGI